MSKVLHLTLKKKWFDMIESGEKKEEYREIKTHYLQRFLYRIELPRTRGGYLSAWKDIENGDYECRSWKEFTGGAPAFNDFESVMFHHGYTKGHRQMTYEFKGIDIGTAKPEWSDNWQGNVFRIKLGNRIS